jgi:hypothetical protein
MKEFGKWMGEYQARWRRGRASTDEHGFHNGRARSWILPPAWWEEGLWPELRTGSGNAIADYLTRENVGKHTGANNLKSSWIACANLYFPFRTTGEDRSMLAGFLRRAVSERIHSVEQIELEYAEEGALHPAELLGESGGSRGASQTSPDIAFLVNSGAGIVLTESKLTEHSFYPCSARNRKDTPNRRGNPDPGRCKNSQLVAANPESLCHQVVWGRKYWERLRAAVDEEALARLKACPAAFAGYQLFRQQALAEGYTQKYDLVVSAVAYDERNETLIDSLRSTGIGSFPDGWGALFRGKARFVAWTHQAWVDWVRRHQSGRWTAWLEWIEARYGYGHIEDSLRNEISRNDLG